MECEKAHSSNVTPAKVPISNARNPNMPVTSIKIILDFEATMRRVDWRWAVAKGYLNKETNQWNEAMGGQAAYLKQRNERMFARFVLVDESTRSIIL